MHYKGYKNQGIKVTKDKVSFKLKYRSLNKAK